MQAGQTVETEMYITWIQENPDGYQRFFSEWMETHHNATKVSSEVRNGTKIVLIAQYETKD